MSSVTYPMTKKGFEDLQRQVAELKNNRKSIANEIAEARSKGDLSENAEYHAAKEKQRLLEKKIMETELMLQNANVVELSAGSMDTVAFSASVELLDLDSDRKFKYKIVGAHETDISRGLISIDAPISRELIGKKKDDVVMVETPRGLKQYKILDIAY